MSSNLSTAQKLVKLFTSKTAFEKMKADSGKWCFTCSSCSKTSSIWDVGGIRYKGKGNSVMRMRCPKCNQVGSQKMVFKENPA